MKKISLVIIAILFCLILTAQNTNSLPEFFTDQIFNTTFDSPTGLTFDENGRLYIWEKQGKVWIIDTLGNRDSEPLLDISEEVGNYDDHGFLGFALDPNFLENGYYYTLYIVDRHHLLYYGTSDYDATASIDAQATIGRVTRYQAEANTDFTTTDYSSRKVLLGENMSDGFPILMLSHGVGSLQFGEDGSLLVSCGDGASFNGWDSGDADDDYNEQAIEDGIIREQEDVGSFRTQMTSSTAGKILRLDPETGEGLSSNPYYDMTAPKSAESRIFVLGFRNPYRFTVRPNTGAHSTSAGNPGALYIGDVGSIFWEEINVATEGGQNFGWPLYEGHWPIQQMQNKWTRHRDAENPYGSSDCGWKFLFKDLIQQPNADGNAIFLNRCDSTKIITYNPLYIHHRPAVTYRNPSIWERPDSVLIPAFDAEGGAIGVNILDTDEVEGEEFQGWASIGGSFYKGANFPEKYHDAYFHADYSGWIKAFWFDEQHHLTKTEPFLTQIRKGNVALVANEKDGCLYYINIVENEISRICYGGDPPPIAAFEVSENYGASPLTVQFDGSASYAPFDYPITLSWDFGDGTTGEGTTIYHTFSTNNNAPKAFEVTLTVTDSVGMTATKKRIISLNNTPPQVEITSFLDGHLYPISDITILPLRAHVEDTEHAPEALTWRWIVELNHNSHSHQEPAQTEAETYAIIDPVGCTDDNYWYTITAEVTDAAGLVGRAEQSLYPDCGTPLVQSMELTGYAADNGNLMTLNVGEQNDVTGYALERTDGFLFEEIDFVDARNTDTYTFLDTQPLIGKNVYRVRAVNGAGRYDFTNKVILNYREGENILLFPNPAEAFLKVDIRQVKGAISLELFTISGQLVQEWNWQSVANQPFTITIAIADIPVGVYVYRLRNGEEKVSGKVIIRQ